MEYEHHRDAGIKCIPFNKLLRLEEYLSGEGAFIVIILDKVLLFILNWLFFCKKLLLPIIHRIFTYSINQKK